MTRDELITQLKAIGEKVKQAKNYDEESGHAEADELLLRYINDPEIEAAYNSFNHWYA